MKAAILNGVLGSVLTLFIGQRYLGLSTSELVLMLGVANLSGLISLLLTLQIQRTQLYIRLPVVGFIKGWSVLLALFLIFLVPFFESLRDIKTLAVLLLPLGMSLGFSIIVFGPIQDFLVRYRYQQEKLRKK
ncbi:hypothetical protein EBS43_09035 [bacterium]|jgi:hypothetical protein|nr:hypothetical protein [bacterium]